MSSRRAPPYAGNSPPAFFSRTHAVSVSFIVQDELAELEIRSEEPNCWFLLLSEMGKQIFRALNKAARKEVRVTVVVLENANGFFDVVLSNNYNF